MSIEAVHRSYALADRFNHYLGDPHEPASRFSFVRCAAMDAAEEFPRDLLALLNDWGLQRYYVPVAFGGALADFQEPLQLIRMVARRDLTVAIAHGKTFLGGVCAWVAADPAQACELADRIFAGDLVSWGLTERDHGSDLLAGEVGAVHAGEAYVLNGEKWLINNATEGSLLSLLVCTDRAAGARGFDVLLVDKREIGQESYECLPKEHTLGIRGADISGIRFRDAVVPLVRRIGPAGSGLETVLKGLQMTRTLCTALSLGAAEHALRLAVSIGAERNLYGPHLNDLPHARRVLTDAYADFLLAEAVSLVAVRSLHVRTDEQALTSAIVKYLVPVRTDDMVGHLGRFLGARSLLNGVFAEGMFQKVQRDNRIVALFDGNTVVNLHAVINHFPCIARGIRAGAPAVDMRSLFDLDTPVGPFERASLSLIARNGSSVLRALPRLVGEVAAVAAGQPDLTATLPLVDRVAAHWARLEGEIVAYTPSRLQVSAMAFDAAERCALCYAAAAVIGLWLHSRSGARGAAGTLWTQAHWLNAVLTRLLQALGDAVVAPVAADDALWQVLMEQAGSEHLLSLIGSGSRGTAG